MKYLYQIEQLFGLVDITVKGSNQLVEKNLLVIGTFRTEIEDNIFFYSCPEFFKDYSHHIKNSVTNTKKEVQNFISRVHLQSQVSQSIGRNSGFRSQHKKKTVVVLPLLDGNRKHNFEHFGLNYVSPNVLVNIS